MHQSYIRVELLEKVNVVYECLCNVPNSIRGFTNDRYVIGESLESKGLRMSRWLLQFLAHTTSHCCIG